MSKSNKSLAERREKAVAKGVSNMAPVFAARAEGAVVTDVEGREFIDFAGGIGVNNVGHCHPKVVEAVKRQAEQLMHTCFHVVQYEPYVELCERLCELTPGNFPKKAVLVNSGAEAVENAIKIARKATGRQAVIAFETGFHGRTLLTMSLTSKVKPYKFGFGPFAPEIYRMPYAYCYRCPMGREYPSCDIACAEHLRNFFIGNVAHENVAALIVEPICGEGGFLTPPPEYFARLQAICKEFGIVFIVDEVQTGVGRTGTMYAIEQWGVEPDLITTAKSLGGGMPISAVVGKAEIMDVTHPGGLGGTYGGNPVCCAASLAVLDVFEEEKLLDVSKALGEKVRARFESWKESIPMVGDVRGKGPMLALELVTDREKKTPATAQAKEVSRRCYEKGLIVLSCGNFGNVIRTLMPLVISDEQLERGLAILEQTLREVAAG
ncbi:4-aminobutyrate aminotransferase [Desulfovibrio sp. X2]|uniref:4-aminobutyrate--2-oxoglutarate transaminase n=1 Tax=Desulfovibrio sp. X2 TaxID=941449 RepID=UPI000358D0CD|nr:4-aminobutyrate--2-oxoglutarate transaminase [Desulfovibrio sp. X2]EPR44528.1 4-aminobutyrate aminotransferase [Desulfovibrio sp. X2]